MDSIELVKEFHEKFGHPIGSKPNILSYERMQFRRDFLMEELKELTNCFNNDHLIGVVDAIADLQYVLDGLWLESGLLEYKQAIMEEIHKSNMSKGCKTEDEAQQTIDFYAENTPYKYHYEKVGDMYVVYRADGKTMKSKNYSKPNLQKILDNDSK